jgi:hypothetical protein
MLLGRSMHDARHKSLSFQEVCITEPSPIEGSAFCFDDHDFSLSHPVFRKGKTEMSSPVRSRRGEEQHL